MSRRTHGRNLARILCSVALPFATAGAFVAVTATPALAALAAIHPIVTSLDVGSGPASGGTLVTITGTGLTGATAVNFGANAGTGLTGNTDTSITVT